MNKSTTVILFFFLVLFSQKVEAQTIQQSENQANNSVLSDEELASYTKQASQMVSFLEFAFNTLGSSKSEFKEKDIIINQSYLKIFKDQHVQIEDDLVEKRDVVTNKDVQAYMKDIDFFFNEAVFRFTIEEVTHELNEKGEVFFKIKTSRNLQATTIEGKQINESKPRFIEINLDAAKGDLKIVSIYTVRAGEEQELAGWWNSLAVGWRNFFAGNTMVGDSILLKDISGIGQNYIFIIPASENHEDSLLYADTVKTNTSSILTEIRRILRTEQVDISGLKGIYNLDPLSALTSLKRLNISNTTISVLDPIRNLSKLESLNASACMIVSLQSLQYSANLRHLDISSTFVSDISFLENCRKLETLDISGLQIDSIGQLWNIENLRELRLNRAGVRSLGGIEKLSTLEILEISGTAITDIEPLNKLTSLQRLNFEQTYITDLRPLSALTKLEYIYFDNTPVSEINALIPIPSLKAVYCDKTLVSREKAISFLQARPGVKIIYESEELSSWWMTLSGNWKKVFTTLVNLDENPTREQLHELTYLKKIDITGKILITDLDPLKKLSSLEELYASGAGIRELNSLKELINLQKLDVSSCEITDLTPLSGLKGLNTLNVSSTKITDIAPLIGLRELRSLSLRQCNIVSATPLFKLSRLEIVYADGVPSVSANINLLWDSIPDALIIYQSARLKDWYNGLTETWKMVFNQLEPLGNTPTPEQLHRIASRRELDLSSSRNITDLYPLRMLPRLETLNISRLQISDLVTLSSTSRLHEFNCSDTPVNDIASLASHKSMRKLVLSNTQLNNIDVVENFHDLELLDISGTQVTRLNAVAICTKLTQLDCYNTRVNSLKALESLTELKLLRIYNTRVSSKNIEKYKNANPGVEVVYY